MVRIHASVRQLRDGKYQTVLMVRNEKGRMRGSFRSVQSHGDKIAARNEARIVAYQAADKARRDCPTTLYEVISN